MIIKSQCTNLLPNTIHDTPRSKPRDILIFVAMQSNLQTISTHPAPAVLIETTHHTALDTPVTATDAADRWLRAAVGELVASGSEACTERPGFRYRSPRPFTAAVSSLVSTNESKLNPITLACHGHACRS